MDIYFKEIKSDVRLTDSRGGGSRQEILRDALKLWREQQEHDEQVQSERRITGGVWAEQQARRR